MVSNGTVGIGFGGLIPIHWDESFGSPLSFFDTNPQITRHLKKQSRHKKANTEQHIPSEAESLEEMDQEVHTYPYMVNIWKELMLEIR